MTPAAVFERFGFYAALLILIAVFRPCRPRSSRCRTGSTSCSRLRRSASWRSAETLVILAGGIDVSVGSILGLGGMISAIVLRDAGVDPVTAIVLGTLSGLVVGLCDGLLITWLGIDPFITTLAMLSVVRGVVYIVSNEYNVECCRIVRISYARAGHIGVIPISVLIFAGLFAVAWLLERRTTIGRSIHALGGNQAAARCAASARRYSKRDLRYSGACAALSGVILTSQVALAVPYQGTGYELDVIAAVVVGGVA